MFRLSKANLCVSCLQPDHDAVGRYDDQGSSQNKIGLEILVADLTA
jgi:hypothetical protein